MEDKVCWAGSSVLGPSPQPASVSTGGGMRQPRPAQKTGPPQRIHPAKAKAQPGDSNEARAPSQ